MEIFISIVMIAPIIALITCLYFFERSEKHQVSKQPAQAKQVHPIAPHSYYKLDTVGDFLQFVGMRISVSTKEEEIFDGELVDLSDSGGCLILRDVEETKGNDTMHYDRKHIPASNVSFIVVVDRHGKLS